MMLVHAGLLAALVALVLLVQWLLDRRAERMRHTCPNCGDERCAGCE